MVTFFVKIDSCAEHPRRKPVAASAASNTFQGKLLPVKNTYTFPELYNPVIFGQPTCPNNTAISPRSPSLCAISWARFRRAVSFQPTDNPMPPSVGGSLESLLGQLAVTLCQVEKHFLNARVSLFRGLHFQHFGAMQTFLRMMSGEEHFRAAKAPGTGAGLGASNN